MCGQTTLDDWPVHLFPEGHPDRKPRESGHAPAQRDNRFPRMVQASGRRNGRSKVERVMRAAGYRFISPEKDWESEGGSIRSGGKPSQGTKKDKRLKKNKKGK